MGLIHCGLVVCAVVINGPRRRRVILRGFGGVHDA